MQCRGEILQPRRLDGHVIIHESQDIAPSLSNPRVEGIRFAWLWFKQIAEATWVAAGELLHYLSGLIVRVIIHHQNLPVNGFRNRQASGTIQCAAESLATVVRT